MVLTGVAILFAIGFVWMPVFYFAQICLLAIIVLTIIDIYLLNKKSSVIECRRTLPNLLSLGSDNNIHLHFQNLSPNSFRLTVYEELPYQLQKRDFLFHFNLASNEKKHITYILKPLQRGEYNFGHCIIYLQSKINFVERKMTLAHNRNVAVYPSLIQMKKFELMAIASISQQYGVKKMRRLGQSYELEHIKNYVRGDDYRNINWKATGRRRELMVNQFEEEKSQQVFCIIDASRNMLMPFDGLSLLDYSINTSLVISNTALLKQDKIGLITFSDKIDKVIAADKSKKHLKLILDALYRQEEKSLEANYEMLFYTVKNSIRMRSLIFLYTNFESYYSLERVLPILRKINAAHLLVVIFFENNEIVDYSKKESKTLEDIFQHTIAEKYVLDKKQIITELKKYGIQAIYTRPENLSINTLNKYLELKSRSLI